MGNKNTGDLREIDYFRIGVGRNQRTVFDPAKLQELADSIAAEGLNQPPTVQPGESPGTYEIVAGERRWRAVGLLGWSSMPVIVRVFADRTSARMTMLIENVQRVDLDPCDEAAAYQEMVEAGVGVDDLARRTGKSADVIRRRLSLLSLHVDVQTLVRYGNLPLGHAELLVGLDNYRQMIALRVFQSGKGVTKQMLAATVSELREEQDQGSLFDIEAFWTLQAQSEPEARRGKKATVDVPRQPSLPRMTVQGVGNCANAIRQYTFDLQAAGFGDAAAVVGETLTQLVQGNYLSL